MIQFDQQSGFVAGTLIHTDKGLVPIEQILVGDIVLSRSENVSDASNEYKQVLKTFKSGEKKKIIYVDYRLVGKGVEHNDEDGLRRLFCTQGHHFWTNIFAYNFESKEFYIESEVGWIPALALEGTSQHSLVTSSSIIAIVDQCEDEYKLVKSYSAQPQIGVLYLNAEDPVATYDFRSKPLYVCEKDKTDLDKSEDYELFSNWIIQFNGKLFGNMEDVYSDFVYNLEIEDFHTFFVSKVGICVHDAPTNIS